LINHLSFFFDEKNQLLPFQWSPLNLMKIRHIACDLMS
jgi:hypothetical protein